MAPKKHGYSRSQRLTRESDLVSVMKAGRRLRTEHLEVRTVTSLFSHMRLAVVVARHGHTIVERNQLRRRLRELARIRMLPKHSRMDIVLRSFPKAYEVAFSVLGEEIDWISTELGRQDRPN